MCIRVRTKHRLPFCHDDHILNIYMLINLLVGLWGGGGSYGYRGRVMLAFEQMGVKKLVTSRSLMVMILVVWVMKIMASFVLIS